MPETPRPLRPSLGGRPTPAAPLTPPAVGGVFGDFDLIARLGAGMHGTVWRARDRTTGDVIALKIMRADLAGDDAWARRFAREADLVSQLSHPSIPKIRRVGILGGRHFVAMDLIPGRTLDAVSRATGPMDLAQAVAILDHVGGALDAAHRRGIVHRDVKPANVIVVPGGRAFLTDFGLARPVDGTTNRVATTLAHGDGSPAYLAPEQFLDEPPGPPADLYALGVCAYEILTRRLPFEAATVVALGMRVVSDAPPSIRTVRPDLSSDVDRAIAQMLAKAPGDRFGSAGAFIQALRAGGRPTPFATPQLGGRPVAAATVLVSATRADPGPASPNVASVAPTLPVETVRLPGQWSVIAVAEGDGAALSGRPTGIAVDAVGRLYVSDRDAQHVVVVTDGGTIVSRLGRRGGGPGQFIWPTGLAIEPDGGVVVADRWHHRLVRFNPDGTPATPWGAEGAGPREFDGPTGVVIDHLGNLHVVDTGNQRVQILAPDGRFVAQWGGRGEALGLLNEPAALAIDTAGNAYIADSGNHRVQKVSPEGWPIAAWGTRGDRPGQFDAPTGIALLPNGHVVVADTGNSRVQVFDTDGRFVETWGGMGDTLGKFRAPVAVAVGLSGAVYVADSRNRRVQRREPDA